MTRTGVLYRLCVLGNVQAREGRALKHCQVSFHAPQRTAAEMVTFTWPSIAPPAADGPRQRLNQAQGPVDAENREEMLSAAPKAADVQKGAGVRPLVETLCGKYELCSDNVASVRLHMVICAPACKAANSRCHTCTRACAAVVLTVCVGGRGA